MIDYRSYQPTDKAACLGIFRSNTPQFFGTQEEPEFAEFLDRMPCPYFILELNGQPIGCGGFFINAEKRAAGLCWGMVNREFHKLGYGKYLLLKRLGEICHDPNADGIFLDTSQHSKGFFEKLGFTVNDIVQDGYFSGLHRHDMELVLTNETRSNILNKLTYIERTFQ